MGRQNYGGSRQVRGSDTQAWLILQCCLPQPAHLAARPPVLTHVLVPCRVAGATAEVAVEETGAVHNNEEAAGAARSSAEAVEAGAVRSSGVSRSSQAPATAAALPEFPLLRI